MVGDMSRVTLKCITH